MKKILKTIIFAVVFLALAVLSIIYGNQQLNDLQKETLNILFIMCGASALYCFVVGEISRNNSQMDKLWSILPIAYTWVVAAKGNMNIRLVVIAILTTIWGVRLTINFAKKGAYSIKFWSGEEDYRWVVLRKNKFLNKKWKWAIFDLLFISIYQNALVLAICLPAVACMNSTKEFGIFDGVVALLVLGFIVYELIADAQQMKFHTKKRELLSEGKKLEDLPEPYNKGFNTTGLWNYSRHPNYLSEQAIWVCLSLFCISSGVASNYVFNWSMVGGFLLVLLFMGSSEFGESVSSKKYPEYKKYQEKVFKYLPIKKYRK